MKVLLVMIFLLIPAGLVCGEGVIHRDPKTFELTPEDRAYWAFQPVGDVSIPLVDGATTIDRFINEELAQRSLVANAVATSEVLIKRLYFDLLGLPPNAEQVRAFMVDPSSDAYERLVNRLLASPRYGERWGRHWLDVVRFAQTNGYERDDEKPEAWRYRDYVIDAFNSDKPYNRFVMEQIAGDELPGGGDEEIVATGFYRLGVWDDEPDDKREAEMDELDDMIRVTSETFMGLTTGCARCHHHMFDPISQQDYYAMQAFFRNVRPYEVPNYAPNSATFTPLGDRDQVVAWEQQWQTKQNQLAALSDQEKAQKRTLEEALKAFRAGQHWAGGYALSVREYGAVAPTTHVLIRGNSGRPGQEIQPAFPVVFNSEAPRLSEVKSHSSTSGRRAVLARWIAGPKHPLTTRVLVNRVWQHHFGKGLVATTNDFGKAGATPTHPALLDWLANDFVEHGFSIKHLHRRILLSEAYRRASDSESANNATDPGNDWLWRQNLQRLEAEVIRDRVLASTGHLHHAMGGRGFFPTFSGEVIAGGSRPGKGWGTSTAEEAARRTVYTFIKRTMIVPLLESFDYSNTEGSLGVRSTTTVPTQALMLLNSEFVLDQSAILARQLLAQGSRNLDGIIQRAYQHTLSRLPTPTELSISRTFLKDQSISQNERVTEMEFRPEVPKSVEKEFYEALPSNRFLVGPRTSWTYDKGQWGGLYEGILNLEPSWGPTAYLDRKVEFLQGQVQVDQQLESLGLLIGEWELQIDVTQNRLMLRRGADIVKESEFTTNMNAWLRFEISPTSFKIGRQTFEVEISGPSLFGVRPWGGAVRLRMLKSESNEDPFYVREDGVHEALPDPESLVRQRAVQQFCSLLFNLNEFVHAD